MLCACLDESELLCCDRSHVAALGLYLLSTNPHLNTFSELSIYFFSVVELEYLFHFHLQYSPTHLG